MEAMVQDMKDISKMEALRHVGILKEYGWKACKVFPISRTFSGDTLKNVVLWYGHHILTSFKTYKEAYAFRRELWASF
jgi:hypothetical protein